MYIAKNLQFLRKRDKITQEELADRLCVSRQSVSKWETGEAYPETDKLIALCDIFGTSLDSLLRSDLTTGENTKNETSDVKKSVASELISHINAFSRAIALGVMLIILGTAACVALSAGGLLLSAERAELMEIMGGVAVIVFVAAALFLFVFYGIRHQKFVTENPVVENVYEKDKIDAFAKRFAATMACLVSGILLDVVFLIVLTSLLDTGIIVSVNFDAATSFVVSAFLALLSVIVSGMVYMGIQRNKYYVDEYNKRSGKIISSHDKLVAAICGVIMMSCTALFLVIGFVWNYWHPGWVVFPVGGIACGIVRTVFSVKKSNK